MNGDFHERAANTDKSRRVVEGANCIELYDVENGVAKAVSKLVDFLIDKL